MKRELSFVAIALLAGTLVSCERENNPIKIQDMATVGVKVSDSEGVSTKAGAASAEFLGSTILEDIDGQDFWIDAYVEDNNIMPFEGGIETKGSIVTTGGANGTVSINASGMKFGLDAWLGSQNRYPNDDGNGRTYAEGGSTGRVNFENDEKNYHFLDAIATKSDDWTLDDTYYWRNNVPTTFWSYYPVADNACTIALPDSTASDANQAKLSFEYMTPTDVTKQNDLLFAYNLHKVKYDNDGKTDDATVIDIHFYHALAAIRFDVSGAVKDDVQIDSVFFNGITLDGKCAVSGTGDSNKSGVVAFDWTPGTTTGKVGQALAATDFTATGLDGKTAKALMPLSSSKFFFFVPQEVKDMEMIIAYTLSDGTKGKRTAKISHDPWEEGKIYTYKLSVDRVDVSIDDTVQSGTKSNIVIKNTGNVDAYLRVAIVANWVDANGNIVAPWTNDISTLGSNWSKNTTDGFYYYSGIVHPELQPGQDTASDTSIDKIFESYTQGTAPVTGAHLVMDLAVQAIPASLGTSYSAAWTAAMASKK